MIHNKKKFVLNNISIGFFELTRRLLKTKIKVSSFGYTVKEKKREWYIKSRDSAEFVIDELLKIDINVGTITNEI